MRTEEIIKNWFDMNSKCEKVAFELFTPTDLCRRHRMHGINHMTISPNKLAAILQHMEMVLEKNKVMNLTAITNTEDFAVKHIVDSLTLLKHLPPEEGLHLADVGTGAGFPGIVLAIMRPDIHVTLIDSLQKRVKFLQEVISALALENAVAVHARVEDIARQGMTFDICTARAVARMDKLCKWALPITKPGGIFLAMKGPDIATELEEALPVMKKYGGIVQAVTREEISEGLVHSIVVVERQAVV